MRRPLAFAAVLGAAAVAGLVATAAPAAAHPLGNFTINHYAGLVVGPDTVAVDYVLDLAEIPTFQERPVNEAPAADRCDDLGAGLRLAAGGDTLSLRVESASVAFVDGRAGLQTTRIECAYLADLPAGAEHRLTYSDDNYPSRLGWREITVRGDRMAVDTDVPAESISDRLTRYDVDGSPPGIRTVVLTATPSGDPPPVAAPVTPATNGADPVGGGGNDTPLLSVLADGDRGLWAFGGALLVAAALGAAHGMAPGHGKTVIAAFLVATRGTRRQALLLAVAVAVSHTLGVFVLGTVTVVASSQFAPERTYPYLQAASAAIVLSLGAWLIVRAILRRRHMAHADDHHPHDHTDHVHTHPDHGHDNGHHPHDEHGQQHPHPHDEDHDRGADTSGGRWHTHGLLPHRHGSALRELDPGAGPLSGRSLLVLGLSGGLVPSTSAVLLLLGAIQLERLFMGGLLILGFGVGMAVALVGTGVGIVALSRRAERRFDAHAWAQRLAANLQPIAGVVMLGVGGYLITRAFATIAG